MVTKKVLFVITVIQLPIQGNLCKVKDNKQTLKNETISNYRIILFAEVKLLYNTLMLNSLFV